MSFLARNQPHNVEQKPHLQLEGLPPNLSPHIQHAKDDRVKSTSGNRCFQFSNLLNDTRLTPNKDGLS